MDRKDFGNEGYPSSINVGREAEKERAMENTAGNTQREQGADLDKSPTEAALSDFLQAQMDQRAESAKAFQADATEEPSMRDLLEEQVKLQQQVRGLKHRLIRVQQGLLVSQFLTVLIAGGLVALVSFFYFKPDDAGRLIGRSEFGGFSEQQAMPSSQAGNQGATVPGATVPGATVPGATVPGATANDVIDPKYQRMILDFFNRANGLRANQANTAEVRMYLQERYIALLGDLSATGEQLAEENAPREVGQMLMKIASYAKEMQSYDQDSPEATMLAKEIARFTGAEGVGDLLRSDRSGSVP